MGVIKSNIRSFSAVGLIVVLFTLLACSVYTELYYESVRSFWTGEEVGIFFGIYTLPCFVRIGALLLVLLMVFLCFKEQLVKGGLFVIKHRFLFALGLLILCMIVGLNNSSSSIWFDWLGCSESKNLVLGVPRGIRSDDFCITGLLNYSQSLNDYSSVSGFLRGTETQVDLVYGLVSLSPLAIFKPFNWGYFIFGPVLGLSFNVCGRIIVLCLATFELLMLLTGKNKGLSVAFTLLISFSPMLQWWQTNDLIIYGELLVIALCLLLNTPNKVIKCCSLVGIPWLAGCYIVVLYPAWMVPLFYIFAAMGIWVIVGYWRHPKEERKQLSVFSAKWDLPILLLLSALSIGVIVCYFYISKDVISVVSGTVYPGARFECGGNGFSLLLGYGASLFFPISQGITTTNVCEASSFFTLFPLGLLLASYALYKTKDLLLGILIAVQIVFVVFMVVGVPEIVAKITLLYNVPTGRMLMGVGVLDLYLMVRSVSLLQNQIDYSKKSVGFIGVIALVVAVISCAGALFSYPDYMGKIFAGLLFIFSFVCCFSLLYSIVSRKKGDYLLCLVAFAIALCAGVFVQPFNFGLNSITDTGLAKDVRTVVKEDNSTNKQWIVEGEWFISNYCVANGASVLSATHAYPNLELWRKVDPEGVYEDVYNRYANITAQLTDGETYFKLTQPDSFTVYLSYDDVKKLNIAYLVSKQNYSEVGSGDLLLTPVSYDEKSAYYIYNVS